jgi:hypothetical protein
MAVVLRRPQRVLCNATTPRGASVRRSHEAPTLFGKNHSFLHLAD